MTDVQARWYTASDIAELVPPERARHLIRKALLEGFEPAMDPARVNIPAGNGHLLLMPSTIEGWTGVKVASVAPGNPSLGLPRIQATYLLLDSATLTTRALMEGSVLTELRTPAVSAVAADALAPARAEHLLVFGTGPQAVSHVRAFAMVRKLTRVTVVGRTRHKVEAVLAKLAGIVPEVVEGTAADVRHADIVVCATSSAEPLFEGSLVRDGACVIAMGSHEPGRRELDASLMGRSLVVVEDTGAALREAGDVIHAIQEGSLAEETLIPLRQVVCGAVRRREDAPNVFKGVGMSWQDLAVAIGVVDGTA